MSDTIHHKWIKYLEANTHLLAGRTADSVIDFAEKELPRFIREHFRKNFNAIYNITDASFYQRILDEYYLNAKAKEDDEKQQRKFTYSIVRTIQSCPLLNLPNFSVIYRPPRCIFLKTATTFSNQLFQS